jgi:hypothetical protein
MHFRNHPDKLQELYRGLLGLTLTARQLGRDWPMRGVSLRAHLRDRLTRTFADGFDVLFAGPVLAWEPGDGENVLRHTGKTTPGAAALPPATPVEEWEGAPAAAPAGVWRATTVEVFAAVSTGSRRLKPAST